MNEHTNSIETDHSVEIKDEIAAQIPQNDPLRHRLKVDEDFAREFVLEQEFG